MEKQLKLHPPYVLELLVYGDMPKSLNRLLGYGKWTKHQNALKWKKRIFDALRTQPLPPVPLEHVKLTFIRRSPRFLDFDGAVGSLKPLADALVMAGILIDDNYKVTGPWFVTQEKVKTIDQHIYLKVEEII